MGNASRPGFTPRPSYNSADFMPNPMENGKAGRSERRSRSFGPDAKPTRRRKSNYGNKGGEMGWKKGPIRERTSGQFFGGDDDDYNDDDMDLEYSSYPKDTDEEDAV